MFKKHPEIPEISTTREGEILLRGKPLKKYLHRLARLYISRSHLGTLYPHRLVAETWVKNPNSLSYVRFRDGDRLNISAENLYWADRPQSDRIKFISRRNKKIRDLKDRGLSQKNIAEILGVSPALVCKSLRKNV